MLLPITLTLAAACALLNLWLAFRCARIRVHGRALHGDGGDPLLAKRMRAHANFIEYTPMILILVGLIEMPIGSPTWLWAGAALYLLARIAHGYGMDADHPTIWRAGGALITWALLAVLALVALYTAYSATRAIPAPPVMASRT